MYNKNSKVITLSYACYITVLLTLSVTSLPSPAPLLNTSTPQQRNYQLARAPVFKLPLLLLWLLFFILLSIYCIVGLPSHPPHSPPAPPPVTLMLFFSRRDDVPVDFPSPPVSAHFLQAPPTTPRRPITSRLVLSPARSSNKQNGAAGEKQRKTSSEPAT